LKMLLLSNHACRENGSDFDHIQKYRHKTVINRI
jgi:hypothetical protein